jgi:phosphoglycerate dehydrogenase-like enzyme
MKIVATNNQDFTEEQKKRLNSLGDVTYFDTAPKNGEEYLQRISGADIICSGTGGLKDAYHQMKDVYVTVSFVSVAFVDLDVLKRNNVKISNAPGANRHAVSEWVVYAMLLLMRQFNDALNRTETYRQNGAFPPLTKGLADCNLTILGKGNVGSQVGKLAEAFGVNVRYFKRGDDLFESVSDADIVVDTLSSNQSTYKLLGSDFFASMKKDSCFVSITRSEIMDEDALIDAIDRGHLSGAASDCGDIMVGDTDDPYYKKLLQHPKIFVSPHISYSSEMSAKVGNDIMIDNVEAWIAGRPQNVLN